MRRTVLSLCLLFAASQQSLAHDFSWKNLLLASLKLNESLDYDANVDSYMQVFRPDVWTRYHNDEFELREKRKETVRLMASHLERFSLDDSFVLNTTTTFGSYDFDKQQYPMAGWTESNYFYESAYPHANFPGTLRVFFSNPQAFGGLPMPESEAKEFLRGRKDRYGNIDRTLYVVLRVRIVKVKDSPQDLLAEIQGGRVYADQKHTALLHEFTVKNNEPGE